MNNKVANLVYIAVAFITIGLIRWSAPAHDYKPHGIVLPMDNHSSNQVRGLAGADYKPLATVHVQYHYATVDQQNFNAARSYARELAKNAGAKGILERQPLEDPNGKMIFVNAIAIQ